MAAELLALAKYMWVGAIAVIAFFLRKRDQDVDKLKDDMHNKMDKEDVKELIRSAIDPVNNELARHRETTIENTLLLREVSSQMTQLSTAVAVQTALYNHIRNTEGNK